MRITYDKEADVLGILLADAEVYETVAIAHGVEVDYDVDGRFLAIEILNASKKYDLRGIKLEAPDPFYSLASAGALFGLSPTTLRHQIERGALSGFKIGRNWVIHRDDLDNYMNERSQKAKLSSTRTFRTRPLSSAAEARRVERALTKRKKLREGVRGK